MMGDRQEKTSFKIFFVHRFITRWRIMGSASGWGKKRIKSIKINLTKLVELRKLYLGHGAGLGFTDQLTQRTKKKNLPPSVCN